MDSVGLRDRVRERYARGERLVAPLLGFPGVTQSGTNIKVAQQNHGVHYRVIKTLYDSYRPDIVFPLMDLSVEANALGRYTIFPREDSATIPKAPFDIEELEELRRIDILLDGRIAGNVETLKLMSHGLPEEALKCAYVTGPFTLAGLIMGSDEAVLGTLTEPQLLHRLLAFATERIVQYAHALISAGAEGICVLEPTAVMLGPDAFAEFSGSYVRRLIETYRFKRVATVYHVCGNSMHLLREMVRAGVDALSLDSPETGVDLLEAAARVPEEVLIIGNVSPTHVMLDASPEEVERVVCRDLAAMRGVMNYVLSTGCDLPQETPAQNIERFMLAGRRCGVNLAA